MKRVLSVLLLFVLCGCAGQDNHPAHQKYQTGFTEYFDTVILITGFAETEEEFDRYAEIITERLAELHRLFDIYNEYKGINNLYTVNQNAGLSPVAVDGELIDMLLLAREGYELSGGAVNIALGSVLRIWHEYRAEGEKLPPMEDLRKAMELTDMEDVLIDREAGTVFLRKAGMSLDIGSVAKAYAAQLAVQAAADAGMRSVLVSAGGNIVSFGKPLDGERDRWIVAIQDPDNPNSDIYADTIYGTDLTVSCSGGYQRNYTVDGQIYHHIIDPETLMPANRFKQVAVIHPNAGLADLLSTALFILPYEEGAELAAACGADVLWIDLDGQWYGTEGYIKISKKLSGYSASD